MNQQQVQPQNDDESTDENLVVLEGPDLAEERRDRSYYKDLHKLDAGSLTKYSEIRIQNGNLELMRQFAQVNETQFRRLWLLFQYQLYRTNMTFTEAKEKVRNYVRNSPAIGAREPDSVISPNRRQTLGALREAKVRMFVEYYDYVKMGTTSKFDIYNHCLYAPLEELFAPPIETQENEDLESEFYFEHPLELVSSIVGEVFKLPSELLKAIRTGDIDYLKNIYIVLPRVDGDRNVSAVDIGLELARRMPIDSDPLELIEF